VTWPQMGNARPVVESSIVSINNAFAKGSLSVKVVDRDGLDLPGVPVSVDPPVNLSSNTNSTGCAVFDGLSAGIYTGHVQKAGYVDPGGTNDVVPPNGWSVSTGSTSVAQYSYDQAGWADFAFDTQLPGPPATTYSIASLNAQPQITLIQPLMPAPGQRVATFAAGASTYTANNLFPFTSPYTAQLGTCPAGMPLNQQTFTAPRGAAANSGSPVVFRLPSVNVTVQRDGVARSAADVKITPPAGCGSARNLLTGADGKPPHVNATDAANVAWPYGNGYTVCVDDNAGGANTRFISQAFNNDVAAGKTFSFNIKTIGAGTTPKGNC
ncbi:MAG: hypothetical protein QOJ07_3633, partial [Thermoleophilaceae bacterium]|nr:hypothetical protein [Thermoleophilaceae bacterium]